MKKISIISSAVFTFLFSLCSICRADVVDPRIEEKNKVANKVAESTDPNIWLYVAIGALVAIVLACAILCIVNIVKKKKEN